MPSTAVAQFGGGVGGIFVPLMLPGMFAGGLLHAWQPTWFPVGFVVLGGLASLGAGYGIPATCAAWLLSLHPGPALTIAGALALALAWFPNRHLPATTAKHPHPPRSVRQTGGV